MVVGKFCFCHLAAHYSADHFFYHTEQDQAEKTREMRLRLLRMQRLLSPAKRRKTMKLTETKADQHGLIRSIVGDAHLAKRVTAIGITEGTAFRMVRNDRKMPVLVYLRETLIAVNRDDAERIEVETL